MSLEETFPDFVFGRLRYYSHGETRDDNISLLGNQVYKLF